MRSKSVAALPATSAGNFWAFVLFTKRSLYDPWWASPACERTFAEWKEHNDARA